MKGYLTLLFSDARMWNPISGCSLGILGFLQASWLVQSTLVFIFRLGDAFVVFPKSGVESRVVRDLSM